jgi:uncharacterized membrane protein
MKERIVAFGDAIIAIIITIIVLELPIQLTQSGTIEVWALLRAIGIYFISFCFVGDLWYQGAGLFSKINKISNKDFVVYMFFLFFMSLIPTFTRLLIEDTNQQVVLIYGLLSFLVTALWTYLVLSLNKQLNQHAADPFIQNKERQRKRMMLLFRLILLVLAFFFPRFGLIIYLILPIMGFLQNMIDHEEDTYIEQMNDEQRAYYLKQWRQPLGHSLTRYKDVLATGKDEQANDYADPQWWVQFNHNWQEQIEKQLAETRTKLAQSTNDQERRHLKMEQNRLQNEKNKAEKVLQRVTNQNNRRQRGPGRKR